MSLCCIALIPYEKQGQKDSRCFLYIFLRLDRKQISFPVFGRVFLFPSCFLSRTASRCLVFAAFCMSCLNNAEQLFLSHQKPFQAYFPIYGPFFSPSVKLLPNRFLLFREALPPFLIIAPFVLCLCMCLFFPQSRQQEIQQIGRASCRERV